MLPDDRTETVSSYPFPGPGAHLPPGTLIGGRYQVQGFLGSGGHAVYRVSDRELRREVALKLLDPDRATPGALARLRREVLVARDAQSPRLVRIFDLGTSPQGAYLTMELVEGRSLRERLREGPLSVEEVLRIAIEILEGLAALHALKIVHRDVKPGNVLLAGGRDAKLADFGLARRLDREETQVTRAEGIVGTLGYLSPEQILGREAGSASDLYSVGVVLFEMLAGRLPHEAASDLGLCLGPLQKAPDLRTFRPDAPRWLAAVVARLLEVDPADRYPTAETVLRDLRRHRAPRRVRLRRNLFLAATIALLLLPQVGVLVAPAPGAAFSRLVPTGEVGIKALSQTGGTLWTIPGVSPEVADRAAFARITPGGPRLLALVLARPQQWSLEAVSTLTFLDPDSGRVVRQVKLPNGADHFPNDPPRFSFASAKTVDLDRDGVDEVLVNYNHVPEAPFYTVLYAPRFDRARVIFYSRGGQDFQGTADLDGDGSLELLFAGVNNGWNWVNAVAAVRLDPRSLGDWDWLPPAAAPDVMEHPAQKRLLLWYAIVPRGHLEAPSRITIDKARHEITVRYLSGKTWTLAFDGFPPEASASDRAGRQEARRATYEHLQEAERLRKAGMLDLAMSEAEAALSSARRAREIWLGQYAERLQARILVGQGRVPEAEARFASLAERAEDGPEVAYDAAVAFHLHGDLSRAVSWYARGMGRGSAIGAGKSKHEFLKGEVLALVEQKRYAEALAAVERFYATYSWQEWPFREYVRWRAGEQPEADPAGVPSNGTDLERYWELEFELAAGGRPAEILRRVDRFLAERPETRAEALSLRAEILARLGRPREAAEVAQSALELVRAEQGRSIIAHGHLDLLEERAHRLRSHGL
jgi:tetratricopeptide (TPR) repeat protein